MLRESAQTPDDDADSFRDYRRWRYYNTNNLWVDLRRPRTRLQEGDGVLELPLIINRKTVDPRDSDSTPVLQLESAMGAAIASFPGARSPARAAHPLRPGQDHRRPARAALRRVHGDRRELVTPVPERAESLPYVALDTDYYKLLDEFEKRFPHGAPSLREAERLVVQGDITFGEGVVVRGEAELARDRARGDRGGGHGGL